MLIDTALDASVVQLGDNWETHLYNRAIALQRAIPIFHGDETSFASYPIFSRSLMEPAFDPQGIMIHQRPLADIRVESVQDVLAAASSLVRIGSGHTLWAESRIKHIRQFNE